MDKPRIGMYGLTSCAGDQLVLLNCEDELLDVVGAVDLRSFVMAQSLPVETELDIAFVEGAVAQPRDLDRLLDIRRRSAILVAIGTCAVWGGIPACRNDLDREQLLRRIHGEARPPAKDGMFAALPAEPLSRHVRVDAAITGCPIEKEWLLHSIVALLHGDPPLAPRQPVCADCKLSEYACLMQERGRMCLGPLTLGGCGARCPGLNRPCLGCRGPVDDANADGQVQLLTGQGFDGRDIRNRLGLFVAGTAERVHGGDRKEEGTR